jgi:transposase
MQTLEQIIKHSKDSRELKSALAVKMSQTKVKHQRIADYLQVSDSFISKWGLIYEKQGANALLLNYQGKVGYLSVDDKQEVISFLRQQSHFSVEQLRDHLEVKYQVVYKSKQSYYQLLDEGGLSWKKNEKVNPKRDPIRVEPTKKSIRNKLKRRSQDIQSGKVVVLIIDECHLRWGEVCGYIWGQRNQSITVPIVNEKQRQTYYGALNNQTKTFQLKAYPAGESRSTINFIKYLRSLYPNRQLILIWDGASYHRSEEVKPYLSQLNRGLRRITDWKVRCLRIAPYAPDQNPVEDLWLQGKNWLRKQFSQNKTFAQVKKCFFDFLTNMTFYFDKMSIYY